MKLIQEHNEKFYSYMHRDLLAEFARGQIELNSRVSGSDISAMEISDSELAALGGLPEEYLGALPEE